MAAKNQSTATPRSLSSVILTEDRFLVQCKTHEIGCSDFSAVADWLLLIKRKIFGEQMKQYRTYRFIILEFGECQFSLI